MKYYIEVFNGKTLLNEWKACLQLDNINTHLEWAAMYLKGIATCIRVYSYDGLHKPGTIREVKFIDLRCE